MSRTIAWRVAATAVLGAVGCSGRSDRMPAAEVVDSAGMRVITYELAGVEVPTHRFVAEHDLQIGEIEGDPEYTFSRIADLGVASDGSMVVSDGVAQEVRVFDATGTFLRTIGHPGEGPGEFAVAPTIAGMAGDTVFVFDGRTRRVTSFTLSGDLGEMLTLRSESVGVLDAIVRLDDGTYISQSRWTVPGRVISFHDATLELDSAVITRLDVAGTPLDTLRVMADRTRARIVSDRGGGRVSVVQANSPYSARAVVASNGRGGVMGHSGVFELEFLRPDRSTETILRVHGVDHPATASQIRAHQEGAIRERRGDQELDPLSRRLNIEFLPERLPSFDNVVVSERGDVWVSLTEYDLSAGLDWLVFDRAGVLQGTVRTPPELRVRAVRGDYIVGFVLDELDVPYVRRYPLADALN